MFDCLEIKSPVILAGIGKKAAYRDPAGICENDGFVCLAQRPNAAGGGRYMTAAERVSDDPVYWTDPGRAGRYYGEAG